MGCGNTKHQNKIEKTLSTQTEQIYNLQIGNIWIRRSEGQRYITIRKTDCIRIVDKSDNQIKTPLKTINESTIMKRRTTPKYLTEQ